VPALKAWLGDVYVGAIQVDRHGNLVVAVSATGQIRVIATTTGRFYRQNMTAGRIYTVAGGGEGGGAGHLGDGGPATKAIISGRPVLWQEHDRGRHLHRRWRWHQAGRRRGCWQGVP